MRADLYLAEYGYAVGRGEAKTLILEGRVKLDGRPLKKPSEAIDERLEHEVSVERSDAVRYASRGGYKLEHALKVFGIDPSGRITLDIGASGGGFTDCLLHRGAASVYALDCGSGQLASYLREDPRVTVMENYNARYLDPDDFPALPSLVTMDVSFISQTLILPAIRALLPDGGELVTLVKPQFEAGRAGVGKGGIVRSPEVREAALSRVLSSAEAMGYRVLGHTVSPITGGDGNTEYLAWFRYDGAGKEGI